MRVESRALTALVLIGILAAAVFARSAPQDEKNAENLVKAARFLEEKPFDKDAKNVRGWAIKWVIETDQVSVMLCSLLISGIDKSYKYSNEIFGQYTIGMAAFKLANPDKAKDEDAAQQAGIESALTSYEAMVKEKPKARHQFLDDLIAKRAAGALSSYVVENNCKDKK